MPILTLRTSDKKIHKVNSELIKYSFTLQKALEHLNIEDLKEGEIISLPYSDSELINKSINFVKLQAKYQEPARHQSIGSNSSDSGSAEGSEGQKIFYLESSDQITFKVNLEVIKESTVFTELVELFTEGADTTLPLPNVDSNTLRIILDLIELKQNATDPPKMLANSVKKLPKADLFKLVKTTSYLDISALFEAAVGEVGNFLSSADHDDIRKTFGFKDDLEEDLRAKITEENYYINN